MNNTINGLKIEQDLLKSKQPFQCPNCNGEGNKQKEYRHNGLSELQFVRCHSCQGTGILWK